MQLKLWEYWCSGLYKALISVPPQSASVNDMRSQSSVQLRLTHCLMRMHGNISHYFTFHCELVESGLILCTVTSPGELYSFTAKSLAQ